VSDRRVSRGARAATALALLAVGAAAMGAAAAGRYVVGTETVRDTETGLTWQRAAAPRNLVWDGARGYCLQLSLAGFDDWRLPTVRELQSLLDVRATNPAADATAFTGLLGGEFWSSTPGVWDGSLAWTVNFSTSGTFYRATAQDHYVRCVR